MLNLINLRPPLVAALAAVSIGATAAGAPDLGPDAGLHRRLGHCGGSRRRYGSRRGPG